MKIKNLISVKIEIFFSHTYYMYIFRLFLSYIVLNRSFLYIFVTNIHIYQHGLTPKRQGPALCGRAGRRPKRQGPRSADPWPSMKGLASGGPAASQHRPRQT